MDILTFILFILGFIFLIKGADFLVEGASAIAKRIGLSDIVIGLTIVSFGTSLPELLVGINAGINEATDLAVGNVLGSNISNVLLILGVASIINPPGITRNTALREVPLSLLASFAILFMVNDVFLDDSGENLLARSDGLILILFFVIFIYYVFLISKSEKPAMLEGSSAEPMPLIKSAGFILLGLAGLYFGGEWIVGGAVDIAHVFGLSESIIGLTVIAIGTSLPELVTSVVAAMKDKADIAIGNVVGSNIFNIFWILGVTASLFGLPFDQSSNFDILIVLLSTLLLNAFIFIDHRYTIQRWQGWIFVMLYVAYISALVLGEMGIISLG
jgi:cation:H+ antiporter